MSSLTGRLARAEHQVRRLVQTPRAFRNWPALIGQMAAARVGRGPQTLRFEARGGVRLSCPNVPGARVPIYEVFADDCYRFDAFLGPLQDEAITVVDIGAHVGAFACGLAARLPRARVLCYEPSPTTARYLRDNVVTNGLAGRVSVTEAAVSGRVGEAVLVDSSPGSALNSLAAARPGRTGVPVRTTTFDAIVAAAGAAVDVVKIDCEGGEYDLVFGSAPESWHDVRRIVLEYHPHAEHSWPQLRDWFAELGFAVRDVAATDVAQGTAWLERRR